MDRRNFLGAACAVASASAIGFEGTARAEGAANTIRLATLAPEGSAWMKVFRAWGVSVKDATGGKLALQFFPGGSQGDERDTVRKMQSGQREGAAGQLDGAAVTTAGLAAIVPSCLVLQAPGVCHSYARIDKVRKELAPDFEKMFDDKGYKLLAWGDAGQGRVFSQVPIRTPADMVGKPTWSWPDDPTWQTVLEVAGVRTIRSVGLPEVYTSLETKQIETFPGTCIAAVAFQWYTKAKYITKEPRGVVVGAVVMRKDKFSALPPEHQKVLVDTGKKVDEALSKAIRKDDNAAYDAIVAKGVIPVSLAEHMGAWDGVMKGAREKLIGKLYAKDLLGRVEHIAKGAI